MRFCDTLVKKKLKFEWICSARVDTITKTMIARMAASGCTLIRYGIESGNQSSLDCINKGITLEQIKDAVKLTRESQIRTVGSFMLGLPGETPEMGRQTIQFAVGLNLDFAEFIAARPLWKTKMYDQCRQEGKLLEDEDGSHNSAVLSPVLIPKIKFIPKAYADKKAVAKIIKLAYRKFYLRYSYVCNLLKNRTNRRYLLKMLRLFWAYRKALFPGNS
jgi:radical SAM superfamily enzyme YgiQ (UPF0313 family)